MKKILIFTLFCITIINLQGNAENLEVTDFLNRKVTFQKSVEKVISTVPSITEIIYALNAEEKLVAVSNWCDYPSQAKEKPNIGDFASPNLEKIIFYNPDVIFATPQKESPTLDKFESMGLNVVCLHPDNLEDLLISIEVIGKILEVEERADSLISEMKTELEQLQPIEDKISVYVEIYKNPIMTVSGNSLLGEMIQRAGGENIAEDMPQAYPTINAEKVVAANPEVIITTYPGASKEEIARRLGWGNISAVKKGNIFVDIDPNLLLRPTPRVIQGMKILNEIFSESVK